MKFIVSDTINFLSKTFPKIFSSFFLEYLKLSYCMKHKSNTKVAIMRKIYNFEEIEEYPVRLFGVLL